MLCCDIERRAESSCRCKTKLTERVARQQQLLFVRAAAADNKTTFLAFSKFVFYAHGGGDSRVGAAGCVPLAKMQTNIEITAFETASFWVL
jgi:hypothetical protein